MICWNICQPRFETSHDFCNPTRELTLRVEMKMHEIKLKYSIVGQAFEEPRSDPDHGRAFCDSDREVLAHPHR